MASDARAPFASRALALCVALLAVCRVAVHAHPAPFSYLDVYVSPSGLSGTFVLHDLDVAHELGSNAPDALLDAARLASLSPAIVRFLTERVTFTADGKPAPWTITGMRPLPDRSAIELSWRAALQAPAGRLVIRATPFPYDPKHQTFLNVYEDSRLVRQHILSLPHPAVDHYPGTLQGGLAVFTAFTKSGIHHIAIGPDHLLFVIALLLLGGTIGRLLGIVTAFTIGHSITLALAALNLVTPPAGVIEPAIALSIVYAGADNLLSSAGARDVRPWTALFFGLVHGFGFANVLREIGLPPKALGISLFSFNLGVEIGQALVVLVVAGTLALIRARSPATARRVATAGSIVVIGAGAYWFLARIV